jgi:hypothetical protein
MVDHDSRKRVAKNFRHFFSIFGLKKFKNSSKIPPGDAAAAAATSSSQQPAAAASMGMVAAWLLHGHAAWAWPMHGHDVASKPGCMVHGMLLLQNRDAWCMGYCGDGEEEFWKQQS